MIAACFSPRLDRRFALAAGEVDLLLLDAFGLGDQRALFPFGGDLLLHRVEDFLRWCQVLDFVAQHLDAPVGRGFVERARPRGPRSSKVRSSSSLPITERSVVCASCVIASM
ncbi:hypothetical protein BJP62_17755 [Jeongeupia sp. USM3]|nr:hypothetical protein BJP62_17755 [Jeongeupia sp. USM3]